MRGNKLKIGLALGGGGARGLAHVGVLNVLERESVPIHCVCGTSMGSVIGGIYASEPDAGKLDRKIRDYYSVNGLQGSWLEFLSKEPKDFKGNLFRELSYYVQKKYMSLVAIRRVSLEDEHVLRKPLEDLLPEIDIRDLKIPFASAAINLTECRDAIIDSGPLIDAVYASSCIEGIFPPLKKDGCLFADGGPTSMIPVEACRHLGADFIIAVYLPLSKQLEDQFNNGLEVVLRADHVSMLKLGRLLLETADVVITPDVEHVHWAAFKKIDECIHKGEMATEAALDEIRMKLAAVERDRRWYGKLRKGFVRLFE